MTRPIALALLTIASLAHATEPRDSEALVAAGLKRYDIEHGVAELTYSGAMTGTETISWDRWGWREHRALEITIQAMGMTEPVRNETFVDGDHITTIVREEATGTTLTDTTTSSSATTGPASVSALVAAGATPAGEREVAGHTCQVYEIPVLSSTVCAWQGFLLDSRTEMLGMQVHIVATSVRDTAPDAATLVLPDGLTITEQLSLPLP